MTDKKSFNADCERYTESKDRVTFGTRLEWAEREPKKVGHAIKKDISEAIRDGLLPSARVSARKVRWFGYSVEVRVDKKSARYFDEERVRERLQLLLSRYDRSGFIYDPGDGAFDDYRQHSLVLHWPEVKKAPAKNLRPRQERLQSKIKEKALDALRSGGSISEILRKLDGLGFATLEFSKGSYALAGLDRDEVTRRLRTALTKTSKGLNVTTKFSVNDRGEIDLKTVKEGYFTSEGEKFYISRKIRTLAQSHTFVLTHSSGEEITGALSYDSSETSAKMSIDQLKGLDDAGIMGLKTGDYVSTGLMSYSRSGRPVRLDVGIVVAVTKEHLYVALRDGTRTVTSHWLSVHKVNRRGKNAGYVSVERSDHSADRVLSIFENLGHEVVKSTQEAQREGLDVYVDVPDPKVDVLIHAREDRDYEVYHGDSYSGIVGSATVKKLGKVLSVTDKEGDTPKVDLELIEVGGKKVPVVKWHTESRHTSIRVSWRE